MSDNPTTTEASDAAEVAPAATGTPLEVQPKLFDEAYVKSLREEAAAARVAKKDAVDSAIKLANEGHQAELASRDTALTELQTEFSAAKLELEKYKLAIEAAVPSDKVQAFVSILQGSDSESLQESAKAAYELAGGFSNNKSAFDPTQGFGGRKDDLPLNGDPILQAIKAAVGVK